MLLSTIYTAHWSWNICVSILILNQKFLDFTLYIYINSKKMDSQNSMAYNAGQAKGETQEKASNLMDRAGNAAESAKESTKEAGQQMKAKAQGAADTVKDAVNKN
ncbi:hypothetical protein L6164_007642 [Bauhinia variegata]|uniref:Uncharacterized protein n=1 Tax=Bauhinia variegata TaxID=167791 RepID=A0ACB9PFN3_BAUVA|nr:hypothetical protein L6164_007642 [Bauhinia variegata]